MSAVRVRQDYGFSPLTNICGVGLFLISSDNKIILSEQSKRITVLGGRYSYTASGTMDWNPFRNVFGGRPSENLEWQQFTHPFQAVCHEAGEEVGHDVYSDNIRLFGLGMDAAKLYFQLSFFERTHRTAQEILEYAGLAEDYNFENAGLEAIDFTLPQMVRVIKNRLWEPAGEAALISLCCREFGMEKVEWALDHPHVRSRIRGKCASFGTNGRGVWGSGPS